MCLLSSLPFQFIDSLMQCVPWLRNKLKFLQNSTMLKRPISFFTHTHTLSLSLFLILSYVLWCAMTCFIWTCLFHAIRRKISCWTKCQARYLCAAPTNPSFYLLGVLLPLSITYWWVTLIYMYIYICEREEMFKELEVCFKNYNWEIYPMGIRILE